MFCILFIFSSNFVYSVLALVYDTNMSVISNG